MAYAERAGFDANLFSDHSLRSGFLTSAAANGASIFKMTDVTNQWIPCRVTFAMLSCSRIMPGAGLL